MDKRRFEHLYYEQGNELKVSEDEYEETKDIKGWKSPYQQRGRETGWQTHRFYWSFNWKLYYFITSDFFSKHDQMIL